MNILKYNNSTPIIVSNEKAICQAVTRNGFSFQKIKSFGDYKNAVFQMMLSRRNLEFLETLSHPGPNIVDLSSASIKPH